jgi:HEPN domain-containing protein
VNPVLVDILDSIQLPYDVQIVLGTLVKALFMEDGKKPPAIHDLRELSSRAHPALGWR